MLYVQGKITQPNGIDLRLLPGRLQAPVNLFLHSLFSQVDIQMNGSVTTSGNAVELRRGREEDSTEVGPILQRHSRTDGYASTDSWRWRHAERRIGQEVDTPIGVAS